MMMKFDEHRLQQNCIEKQTNKKITKKKYQYNPFLTSDFIVWVQFAETFTVAICLNAIPQNPLGISIVPNYTKA